VAELPCQERGARRSGRQRGARFRWSVCSSSGLRRRVCRFQVRRPVFQQIFWDLRPGQKPDISLEKYKAVVKLLVAATATVGRHYVTYLGPPNGPTQRTNPVRYVQYECYEATAGTETRKKLGRIPWPPREISGEDAQARTRFSGHHEGAAKCTGARARPAPCAAKAEPPGHKAREADESGSHRGSFQQFQIPQ
jgi:hypothetical protein